MKPRGGRRETTDGGKVLKERRPPRGRGRMGTGVIRRTRLVVVRDERQRRRREEDVADAARDHDRVHERAQDLEAQRGGGHRDESGVDGRHVARGAATTRSDDYRSIGDGKFFLLFSALRTTTTRTRTGSERKIVVVSWTWIGFARDAPLSTRADAAAAAAIRPSCSSSRSASRSGRRRLRSSSLASPSSARRKQPSRRVDARAAGREEPPMIPRRPPPAVRARETSRCDGIRSR